MAIEDTQEFQDRLARHRARGPEAMQEEIALLRALNPSWTAGQLQAAAQKIVMLRNQRARSLWNPLTWL